MDDFKAYVYEIHRPFSLNLLSCFTPVFHFISTYLFPIIMLQLRNEVQHWREMS